MRALAIVHQPDAGPGVFAEAVAMAGWELHEWPISSVNVPPEDPLGFDAVMSFGATAHVDQEDRHPWLAFEKRLLAEALAAGVPLLGVCLGSQLLAGAAGAPARRAAQPEIGWHPVTVTGAGAADAVIGPLTPGFTAFSWHSYECDLPPRAVALASSPACLQAYRIGERAWGIQFHAEVTRADVIHWIEDLGGDPDAVRAGVEPARLRRQTERSIAGWNTLGRGLCGRFLAAAVALRPRPTR